MKYHDISVLLIEDNPSDARLIEAYLRETGLANLNITKVTTLHSALIELDRKKPDLILLDLELPDSRGVDTVKRCCQKAEETPVIVMTGLEYPEIAAKVKKIGAKELFIKDKITLEKFEQIIEKTFQHNQLDSSLQKFDKNFQNLIETLTDGILVLDREGKVLYTNHAVLELFGCSEAELLGEYFGYVVVNFKTTNVDIVRKDGEKRVAALYLSEAYWEHERASIVTLRDTTQQVQVNEELYKMEEMYHTLVDTLPNVVVATDMEFAIQYVSDNTVDLFGYQNAEEMLGMNAIQFFAPEDHERLFENIQKLMDTGKSRHHEYQFVRWDGRRFAGEISVSIIKDPQGKPKSLVGIVRDIGDRLRVAKLLGLLNQESLEMWSVGKTNDIFQVVGKSFWNLGFTCLIFLLDEGRIKISPVYWNYDSQLLKKAEQLLNKNANDFSYPYRENTLLREIVDERKTLLIEDVEALAKQMFTKGMEHVVVNVIRILKIPKSILTPLIVDDDVIGLLSVQADDLMEVDIPAITAFSHQIATALKQARLIEQAQKEIAVRMEAELILEKRLEEIALMNALVNAGTKETDEGDFIRQAGEAICQYFQVENVGILILYPEKNILQIFRWSRGNFEYEKQPIKQSVEGITGKVLATGEFINQGNVLKDVQYFVRDASIRAELCAPIKNQAQILGAINLESSELNAFNKSDENLLLLLGDQLATALVKIRLFEETKSKTEELASLYDITLAISEELDKEALLNRLYEQIDRFLSPDIFSLSLLDTAASELVLEIAIEEGKPLLDWMGARYKLDEGGLTGWVIKNRKCLIIPDMRETENLPTNPIHSGRIAISWLGVPLIMRDIVIGALTVQSFEENAFNNTHREFLKALGRQAAIALENARLFEETNQRVAELEILNSISSDLRKVSSVSEMLPLILERVVQFLGAGFGSIYLEEEETSDLVANFYYPEAPTLLSLRNKLGEGLIGLVAKSGEIHISDNLLEDGKAVFDATEIEYVKDMKASITMPLETDRKIIGVMGIGMKDAHQFTEFEISMLTSISNMAANAVQRATLSEQTQRNLDKLSALRSIDRAIAANLELNVTLDYCLEQIINQLGVDAAVILRFNPMMKTLEYATGKGFYSQEVYKTKVRLGVIYAGRAALEQKTIVVENIHQDEYLKDVPKLFEREAVVGYCVVPLIIKGEVKGVLEVMKRSELFYNDEWLDFLETLAEQAAIAIDNTMLFERVKRSNQELFMAYDQTIQGWSKALELRQLEVEGHSERVTTLTEAVARDLDISEDAIVHLRRGALLHDIGKMRLSDDLLNKVDGLNEEEWDTIHQHPIDAYHLLNSISFLKPALDIPRYHHERWNGSGYPYGLKGEQIPLAARIFAVIDVWDSLNSSRKYRGAWQEGQILGYIYENSGLLFDPDVVKAFFRVMDVNPESLVYDKQRIKLMLNTIKND